MASRSPGAVGPIPNYRITRRPDFSLQFNPPVGSLELANALAFKYPFEPDLESQIRRALMDHWTSEYTSSTTQLHLESPSMTPPVQTGSSMTRCEITTGDPSDRKRTRSKFNKAKRKKVAEVRKHGACAFHRKKKVECTCPLLEMSSASSTTNLETTSAATPSISTQPVSDLGFSGTDDFNSYISNFTTEQIGSGNETATDDFDALWTF